MYPNAKKTFVKMENSVVTEEAEKGFFPVN